MIGGKVIATIQDDPMTMLWCWDHRSAEDECGVVVLTEDEMPQVGDDVWWQGDKVMWTPKDRRFTDRALFKIGCSSSGPEMMNWRDSMASILTRKEPRP